MSKRNYNHDEKNITTALGMSDEELQKVLYTTRECFRKETKVSKIIETLENSSLDRRDLCFMLAKTIITGARDKEKSESTTSEKDLLAELKELVETM